MIIADGAQPFEPHVAPLQLLFVILLEQQGADEPYDRAVVGEDADHVGASFDLGIEPLEGIGRCELLAVRLWEIREREHVVFHLVHHRRALRELLAQLIGNDTPLRVRRFGGFLRNVMAHVAQHRKLQIAEAFRSILSQSTAGDARARAVTVIEQYGKTCAKAMEVLAAGLDDVLAFYAFPPVHRRKLWSSNPIEHLNGTLRKRTNVVGVFPNRNSAIRLISMVLIEQTEDWITERTYMSEESMQVAIRNAPGYNQPA